MPDPSAVQERIQASRKYRDLHANVIRRQVETLAERYPSDKALEQAVRRKLHQAFGAYLDGNWLRKFKSGLDELDSGDAESVLRSSRRLMALHASTRERTSILPDFRDLIADVVPEDGTVVDLACGMNVLTLPVVNQMRRFSYTGIDLHAGLMSQMASYSEKAGLDARFEWDDVLSADVPSCDVVMLLKLLPCLEHQEDGSAAEFLQKLNARTILISYPTRSLGGANVGMEGNYDLQVHGLAEQVGRSVSHIGTETEVFYVMS